MRKLENFTNIQEYQKISGENFKNNEKLRLFLISQKNLQKHQGFLGNLSISYIDLDLFLIKICFNWCINISEIHVMCQSIQLVTCWRCPSPSALLSSALKGTWLPMAPHATPLALASGMASDLHEHTNWPHKNRSLQWPLARAARARAVA